MARKSKFPKITRRQARAVKAAADALTKTERVYADGQRVTKQIQSKEKVRPLNHDEKTNLIWSIGIGVINGQVPTRQGIELIEHLPLAQLRLVEARERDNGTRKKTRIRTPRR